MNFYAMKNNSGVAWSPILGQGNFHKASRFGRITWVDPSAAPAVAPAAAGSASVTSAPQLRPGGPMLHRAAQMPARPAPTSSP
jgi:hypothetical protein